MQESKLSKLLTWLLWKYEPVVYLIGVLLRSPYSVKKVNGPTFYRWEHLIERGSVFLTNTYGEASNVINPSHDGKHGAIFFGTGLRSHLDTLIVQLTKDGNQDAVARLTRALKNVDEDIPYVIEAVGPGVVATDIVTFLCSKDHVRLLKCKLGPVVAERAALMSIGELGKPYDYGFSLNDEQRYCFELVGWSYRRVCPEIDLPMGHTLGQTTYMAYSFVDSHDFVVLADTDSD